MSKLKNYVENLKEKFNNEPNLSEPEKIMYVYLDLGKKFKFNQDFYFSGSKERKKIYDHSNFFDYLEECFENNSIICKSSANICQYIFKSLGINCITQVDSNDLRKYKHVYNIIIPKDGSESYSIDLQDDIENIEFHAFTKSFGLSLSEPHKYVISRNDQKKMHEKFGYISKTNPYVDDYIYLFKQYLPMFPNFNQRIDFVLQNIDPKKLEGIDYWERKWKHDKFISELFPKEDIDKNLKTLEVFKNEKNKKKFFNTYYILEKGNPQIYMFSEDEGKYDKLTITDFAKLIKSGFSLTQSSQGVPKLKAELNKLDEYEH